MTCAACSRTWARAGEWAPPFFLDPALRQYPATPPCRRGALQADWSSSLNHYRFGRSRIRPSDLSEEPIEVQRSRTCPSELALDALIVRRVEEQLRPRRALAVFYGYFLLDLVRVLVIAQIFALVVFRRRTGLLFWWGKLVALLARLTTSSSSSSYSSVLLAVERQDFPIIPAPGGHHPDASLRAAGPSWPWASFFGLALRPPCTASSAASLRHSGVLVVVARRRRAGLAPRRRRRRGRAAAAARAARRQAHGEAPRRSRRRRTRPRSSWLFALARAFLAGRRAGGSSSLSGSSKMASVVVFGFGLAFGSLGGRLGRGALGHLRDRYRRRSGSSKMAPVVVGRAPAWLLPARRRAGSAAKLAAIIFGSSSPEPRRAHGYLAASSAASDVYERARKAHFGELAKLFRAARHARTRSPGRERSCVITALLQRSTSKCSSSTAFAAQLRQPWLQSWAFG